MPCGRMPSTRQPVKEKAGKRTNGSRTRAASNQKEKPARSPAFPRFPHSREFLCGKKFASLRQERNFFQQRNSVFAARKRPPRRRNAPYGQFPRLFFNNSAPVSALPPHRTDAESGGKPSFLTGNPGIWRHSGTCAAGDSSPRNSYRPALVSEAHFSKPICAVLSSGGTK